MTDDEITLRDQIAREVLLELIKGIERREGNLPTAEKLAKASYNLADAMIARRIK